MRKFFVYLFLVSMAVALLVSTSVVTASAEAPHDVKFAVSYDVNAANELIYKVDLLENDGINSLTLRVDFDDSKLTLLDAQTDKSALKELDPALLDSFSEGETRSPYWILFAGENKNVSATGRVFTLRFGLKEGVKATDGDVKFVVRELTYIPDGEYEPIHNETYGEVHPNEEGQKLKDGGFVQSTMSYYVSSEGKLSIEKTETFTPGETPIEEEGVNTPLIVGLSVGGTVIITGVIVGVYFLKKRKNTIDKDDQQ